MFDLIYLYNYLAGSREQLMNSDVLRNKLACKKIANINGHWKKKLYRAIDLNETCVTNHSGFFFFSNK